MSKATADVIEERIRQVMAEGWDYEADDEYRDGSLAQVAACYALPKGVGRNRNERVRVDVSGGRGDTPVWGYELRTVPELWPSTWDAAWWKPKDRRRDLVRAAALLIAEIERLDRAEALTP